ncbi:nudix hydrolase 20, chloroplastic-like isoform X2 [Carica papaya]|uniref:nudix hydrolase 20, chloroplastic-like isoform X2 n=1 Tax=Carica papaya TaxID=3649 RepID=UPI000B8D1641|nr:nudix hydrolase 20, chloroplastic-like isoform X2 [Carica papaya]
MFCNLQNISLIHCSLSCLRISKVSHKFPKRLSTAFSFPSSHFSSTRLCNPRAISAAAITTSSSSFTWDDVIAVSRPEYAPHDYSNLKGFFDKIKFCNRGAELQPEFIRFVVDGQTVGYIHKSFADHLRGFRNVFTFPQDNSYGNQFGCYVTLHTMLKTPEEKTRAVGEVIKCLSEKELIPGIRNELYPVSSSFGASVFFSLERAAAPYFGIKAYGVHMNGYVEKDGQKFLWIGKRSQVKPTYPGMLDHLVAGGLPHGMACGENLIKECEEEAGIPRSIAVERRSGELQVGTCYACCKCNKEDRVFQTKLLPCHY